MKITDPKNLSNYLRDQRKARGLSQAQVGDLVGMRQGTVSKFESLPDKMQLDTLFRLLSALELELTVEPKSTKLHTEANDSSSTHGKWTEDW